MGRSLTSAKCRCYIARGPARAMHRNGGSMGGQTMGRRELVRLMGLAAAASAYPGFRAWAYGEDAAPARVAAREAYRPLFFDDAQFRTVDALAEHVIPEDGSAGAHAAGVAEFIDFMVAHRVAVGSAAAAEPSPEAQDRGAGSDLQRQWLEGLAWLDAYCQGAHGHAFIECAHAEQLALLESLAYEAKHSAGTAAGREFFQLLRDYTVAGYYTSRAGLEALGYAGLRSTWEAMPACPHTDDPDHLHLPAPVP